MIVHWFTPDHYLHFIRNLDSSEDPWQEIDRLLSQTSEDLDVLLTQREQTSPEADDKFKIQKYQEIQSIEDESEETTQGVGSTATRATLSGILLCYN